MDGKTPISYFFPRNSVFDVKFDVLRAVTVDSTMFWVATPCSSETAQRLRGIFASILKVDD
jgi:hypothetical protein